MVVPVIALLMRSLQREWQAKYHAMFKDELTGLPNRNQLIQDINESKNTHLALIEINNFNDVINTYGPAVDYLQGFHLGQPEHKV